jgi:hypothetical protein
LALTLTFGVGAALAATPQVATPISVKQGKVIPDCGPGGASCGWPELLVTISFTSRVVITNGATWYKVELQFTPTGPCLHGHNDGLAASTTSDVRVGQRVHITIGVSNCPGIVHGAVVYDGSTFPHTGTAVAGLPARIDGFLVGTFNFHMR